DLAVVLVEVEADKLYVEVGSGTWDDWARKHAPVSYRLCYMIKARYKALKESLSLSEMKRIPPETAQWASKSKNISPAALKEPKVKEALMLPKQKAVAALRDALPNEHIEDVSRIILKVSSSQKEAIEDGYEAFKRFKDDKASFEDFIEFSVAEWMETPHADGG